jgi:hypothetical protein
MVELRSQDSLLATCCRLRIETGQNENVFPGIGLRILEVLRLLRAAPRDRQNDQIAGLAAGQQVVERTQHGGPVRGRIQQAANVHDAATSQRGLDVTRICNRALERRFELIGVDPDDERTCLTSRRPKLFILR